MNQQQYERVKQLFESCRVLPRHERSDLLSSQEDDAAVQEEVQALLDAYDQSVDFMERPAIEDQAAIVEHAIRQRGELKPGSAIAHYVITAAIGAGGMGVVYEALDKKLRRSVALKTLPAAMADDPLRRARFLTEARALAALNHPNIAAIYGIEDGVLVMELVPGPTLRERIQDGGPIPLDEALEIAKQIAEGLEAAHERGITHRDLKPSNIKLTPDGGVKLLDFGLAKTGDSSSGSGSGSGNEPLSTPGLVMGTAGYMSPEQAAGRRVDKRADVWAFGVVLFEILSGRRPFELDSSNEMLVPEGSNLEIRRGSAPAIAPPQLQELLRRCLERNPKRRLRDIGEARVALEDLISGASNTVPATIVSPTVPSGSEIRFWRIGIAVCALAALILGWQLWRASQPEPGPLIRMSVDLGPEAIAMQNWTAGISPDGSQLIYVIRNRSGMPVLVTRRMDETEYRVLEGAEALSETFFSPDGKWIGFFSRGSVKKVSVLGGAAITLCRAGVAPRGASWGADGYIIANLDSSKLWRIPENGGDPVPLPQMPEHFGEQTWRWPQILPGGEYVVFTGSRGPGVGGGYEEANIEALHLKTGERKVLHRGGYYGRYLPSGHLTFVHNGTLFALRLDLATLQTRGTPVPILNDVAGNLETAGGQLDFSLTPASRGTFVYRSGKADAGGRKLVTVTEKGQVTELAHEVGLLTPRFSPDGRLLAFSTGGDIALYDLERGTRTPITSNGLRSRSPVWAPDGKHLIYTQLGSEETSIWWVRSDGTGQPHKLFATHEGLRGEHFSPDGKRLFLSRQFAATGWDIWVLPIDFSDPERPKAGQPVELVREPLSQTYPALSPDGRWLAYSADMPGTVTELFVQRADHPAGSGGAASTRWRVSPNGGKFPVWSKTGNQLYFFSRDLQVMKVSYTLTAEGKFQATAPVPAFEQRLAPTGVNWNFDVSPDGKRMVGFAAPTAAPAPKGNEHVTVLLNFFDELKRRVP